MNALSAWVGRAGHTIERLCTIANGIGISTVAIMMVLTTVDVSLRRLLNLPIKGAYEITEFLMVILVFWGLAYAMVKQRHISTDFLTSRGSPRIQKILSIAHNSVGAVVLGLITWQLAVRAGVLQSRALISGALYIPIFPFYYVAAFGCALFCLVFLLYLLLLCSPESKRR